MWSDRNVTYLIGLWKIEKTEDSSERVVIGDCWRRWRCCCFCCCWWWGLNLFDINEVYIAFETPPVYTKYLQVERAEDSSSVHSTWHAAPHRFTICWNVKCLYQELSRFSRIFCAYGPCEQGFSVECRGEQDLGDLQFSRTQRLIRIVSESCTWSDRFWRFLGIPGVIWNVANASVVYFLGKPALTRHSCLLFYAASLGLSILWLF